MILHASVVADEPRKTAETLAGLLGGIALPLGPGEGTWSAIGPDPIGNMISVLKRGSEFHRTDDHVDTRLGAPVRHSAYHMLIDTALSESEVLSLAEECGCHALRAKHGAFDVIEFWFDDCLLIEVVTPDMGRDYRDLIQSDELRQRLAPIVAGGLAREAENAR
jgi:hypothetical protein